VDELEGFWREADRRYAQTQTPRIRKAAVTAAASPFSYSVLFPGETDDRSGVGRVSAVTPLKGDDVWVGLVEDEPTIVAVLNRGKINQQDSNTAVAGTASATFITSGSVSDVITQDLVAGQIVRVTVRARAWHTVAGSGHGAVLSFKVTGASTYGPFDDDGAENDDTVSTTITSTTLYTADNTGSHDIALVYRAIGGATANFVQRRITVIE
jgi:hypothetical protein